MFIPIIYKVLPYFVIWGEDSVQAKLEGCKKNKQIFEKIVREMKAAGYKQTAVQCWEKIKKLQGD